MKRYVSAHSNNKLDVAWDYYVTYYRGLGESVSYRLIHVNARQFCIVYENDIKIAVF